MVLCAIGVTVYFGKSLFSARDVSDSSEYAEVIGRKMITASDLYLVKFPATPLLVLGDSDSVSTALPSEESIENVGKVFGEMVIEELIPAGTEVVISGVEKTVSTSPELRGRIGSKEVDLSFIQDYSSPVGSFRTGVMHLSTANQQSQ